METFRSLLADPAFWGVVSAVSAFVAVPIAVLALMSSRKTDRRMVEIEESRDLASERQASKAVLVTDWELPRVETLEFGGGRRRYGFCLTVANKGQGPARRIRVEIDGSDVTSQARAPLDEDGRVARLDPGAIFKISFDSSGPAAWRRVRLEWEDGSGAPGLYESDL